MERLLTEKFSGKTKKGNDYFGLRFGAELIGTDLYVERTLFVNKDVYAKVKEGAKLRIIE